jgi:hypothetical protein
MDAAMDREFERLVKNVARDYARWAKGHSADAVSDIAAMDRSRDALHAYHLAQVAAARAVAVRACREALERDGRFILRLGVPVSGQEMLEVLVGSATALLPEPGTKTKEGESDG